MPADTLKATIDTWNQDVNAKDDKQFGRTTGMEADLSTAPYYAIKIAPGIHHTMGGVKINTKTEVLREDGTPIKGLYAAGELTGGLHGQNRIGAMPSPILSFMVVKQVRNQQNLPLLKNN